MDERLPAQRYELLEICKETVELVILLPWYLMPPPWIFVSFLLQLQFCFVSLPQSFVAICFFPPLLWCCYWNEGPETLGKLPWSFSSIWLTLLNNRWIFFQKDFHHKFAATLLYSLTSFSGSTCLIECCNFDGTKSIYLFGQVKKWFVLEDLESCPQIKEEHQTPWHSPTLIILWIREPSRREPFAVFFPESYRYKGVTFLLQMIF